MATTASAKRNGGRSQTRVTAGSRPSGKNKPPKAARIKERVDTVRGKEVSVGDSADEAQIVYGKMQIGGNVTYIEVSADARAYLVLGNEGDENQILYTARAVGDAGNDITIEYVMPPTNNATLTVQVTGTNILITLTRLGGNSTTQATHIINKIRDTPAADALVEVNRVITNVNGYITESIEATPLAYGGGNVLHQMITLTGHEIQSVDKLFLDKREVTFGDSPDPRWGTGIWQKRVFMAFANGHPDQAAQPDLMGQMPSRWTSAHRQRGWSGIYLILVADENVFPTLPEVTVEVSGKKVFDPRNSTTAYSNNAALCIADFLENKDYGYGIPRERIDTASWIAAANACDGLFEINGVFDVGPRDDILRQLEQAMAGEVVESGGKYFILPGVWRNSVLDLTVDDLRGELTMNTHVSLSDTFNCVRGTYVSPTDNYVVTDFPPYKNSTYMAEDGRELYLDLALNFVTVPLQAQKISKIELEKVRQGISLSFPGKASCYLARKGDNVRFTYARFGYNLKYFRVEEVEFVVESDGALGTNLILRETHPDNFDWNNGDETTVDPAPNTTLPDPFDVTEPEDLELFSGTDQLYVKSDGTIASRIKVQWDSAADDIAVTNTTIEVQMKIHGSVDYETKALVSGSTNFVHILDVKDYRPPQSNTTYDVRVRRINSLNIKSNWVEQLDYAVIGKTAPPSAVVVFSASPTPLGIVFLWEHIPDLDKNEYEIRFGNSWEDSQFIWRGKGTTARWDTRTAGQYLFWIKAIDTSENYSATAAQAELSVSRPGPATVTYELNGPNVVFRWSAQPGDFKIDAYILSYGPEFATSTQVARISTNSFVHRVDWGGVRTFWVAAVDIHGNIGTIGPESLQSINILNPNPVKAFATQVVNQNVLLDWQLPDPSSLPISHYLIYKGESIEVAVLIGTKYGTFHTYLERFGGTFTYHVETVDTAGNVSESVLAQARVEEPDNFYIKEDNDLLLNESPTLLNAVQVPRYPEKDRIDIYLPVDTKLPVESLPHLINPILETGVESFQAWWDNNGWQTLQTAVDSGFDYPFLAPTTTVPGRVTWLVDYEVNFNSSFLNFQYEAENIGDLVNFTPSIEISGDGETWESFPGHTQVFAKNFRYVRYILDFQGSSDKAFGKIIKARALISLERKEEFIIVDCLAANHATGGTPFTFTLDFLDVEDLQATPWGTLQPGQDPEELLGIAVPNFIDEDEPEGGKVLFFDKDGNPKDGRVRIRVIGAIQA